MECVTYPLAGYCCAVVCEREQLRYTGRGKHGFERHYIHRQCMRRATGIVYCTQHERIARREAK